MRSLLLLAAGFLLLASSCSPENPGIRHVERWGMYDTSLHGPSTGNPFTDVTLEATFTHPDTTIHVTGFYDGGNRYVVRFMPGVPGTWNYEISSNTAALDGAEGSFLCTEPAEGNHGPVEVYDTYHFRYADGTPYKQVGTTCYAWIHQGDSLEERTLETLADAPFNKLRMCIFPKDYTFNENEPVYYPFKRDTLGRNDYSRFDPAFWQHLERRLLQLQELGIEADIILFHPYDRWGYASMSDRQDQFYLEYVLARLSAFRNVWWSLANEFDLMNDKSMSDWHRIFEILHDRDPYGHLRSIHNCVEFYDHSLPWVTHASLQTTDYDRVEEWRRKYRKPVIFDECRYEGDVEYGWGNLSPQEMTAMFWRSLVHDIYAGHGETYLHPDSILWWSKGGVLHGGSPERIAFFRKYLEEVPENGLKIINDYGAGKYGEYYIYYFDKEAPVSHTFTMPGNRWYRVEVIDTWNMTGKALGDRFRGTFTIDLPGRQYMAVKITRSDLIFPIKQIEAEPWGSLFHEQMEVKLMHPDRQNIRYTLDGNDPRRGSARYDGPIAIDRDMTLKAKVFEKTRSGDLFTINYRQADLKEAVKVDDYAPGLVFEYYEGEWEKLPGFESMQPLKTGVIPNFTMNERERDDYFGFVYKGLIEVPTDEVYTFFLSSDDGSALTIDGTRVVTNDGIHGIVEEKGQVGLEAGYHKLEVQFFDNWYDQLLEVFISSPGMKKQRIPDTMLYHVH